MSVEKKSTELTKASVKFEENKQACDLAFGDSPLKDVCIQQAVKVFEAQIKSTLTIS